jgi:hypothetical protein
MPNQWTKNNPPTRSQKPIALRLRPEEREDLKAQAERDNMTVADVIRERCGWAREDGQPNRPWSNQHAKAK